MLAFYINVFVSMFLFTSPNNPNACMWTVQRECVRVFAYVIMSCDQPHYVRAGLCVPGRGGSTQWETLLFNFSTSPPSVMKLPSRTFAHTLPVLLAGNWDVTEHEYPLRLPQTDLPATLQIALCLNGHIIFYLDLHLKVIVSRRGLLQ